MSLAEIQAEYQEATTRLSLPSGSPSFPTGVPAPSEESVFEEGFGTSFAERFWICAWEKEWLAQRSRDDARATEALSQLERAPQTEFMSRRLDDAGRRLFDEYLTKARLGDPSGFQQDVNQNCSS